MFHLRLCEFVFAVESYLSTEALWFCRCFFHIISFILLCLCVSEIFIQENICVCIRTLFVTSRILSFCLCFCAYVFKRWVSLILFVFFFFKNRVWSNLSINDFARGGFRKLCFNFDTYAKRIRCSTIQNWAHFCAL